LIAAWAQIRPDLAANCAEPTITPPAAGHDRRLGAEGGQI
jgi:hypothetical protein